MRKYPENESEYKELGELNAEEWMIECLKKNPDYVWWGNYEDYMCKKDGWDGAIESDSIEEGLWNLDELNELVNYYFEVYRSNIECEECENSGYNKKTKQISDDWYDFNNTGRRWCDKITQDEVDALWKNNRLHHDFKETPTAEEVNKWSKGRGIGHDAINHWICVEQRAKRLGVWGYCEHCEGKGRIYTEPKAKIGLQLWMLHPRKGCSRGVYIKDIKQEELSTVISHLKEAQKRNNERFAKL